MRLKSVILAAAFLAVLWATAAYSASSEMNRSEHRTAMGSVLIDPDPASGGPLSVWFLESGNGDLFWIDSLDNLPPDQQQFFKAANQQARFITIEADFEWWGEGNVLRNIKRLEAQ